MKKNKVAISPKNAVYREIHTIIFLNLIIIYYIIANKFCQTNFPKILSVN
jgi:hypothetical protein